MLHIRLLRDFLVPDLNKFQNLSNQLSSINEDKTLQQISAILNRIQQKTTENTSLI